MITRPICRTFVWLAQQTWHNLGDAYSLNMPLKEESITDFLLLELARWHPTEVICRPFTRHEESRTGADWEWWLTANGAYLGFRVQAKVLNSKILEYKQLFKSDNNGNLQMNKLITDAQAKGMPALYCFYNFWPSATYSPIWNCGSFPPREPYLGCSIASARVVKSISQRNNTKKLKDIQPHCNPWLCLVCCEGYSDPGDTLPYRAAGLIRTLSIGNTESIRDTDNIRVIKDPPGYVKAIEEEQRSRASDREEVPLWYKKYEEEFVGLRGLVLLKEDNE